MSGLFKFQRRVACRGFSLLELLMVLVVSAIVLALAAEGYAAMVQANAVTTSADMISDLLTEGRIDAVTQNTEVEVRIYDLPPQAGGTPVYDALQLHWIKSNGASPPVANPVLLSSWVVIDATATHSTLIASNPQAATPDATDARLNSATRVFHFLPDGSTDLNPATNWFMTVRAANQSDPAHFPSDWACVAVDAATGRTQIYRP